MKSTFALSLTAGATLVLFTFLLANPVRLEKVNLKLKEFID